KPFKKLHEEQIKLVSNFDWLDLSKLHGIEDEFREIVRNSEFLDEVRIGNLCTALRGRVNQLQSIIDGGITYSSSVDNLSMDVRENIAYHGKS
ncbi:MAG TPA: excisionase, partial [Lachnospiraceae bacterium]|nr:excisionase [Lachnospiraceae bacterium]